MGYCPHGTFRDYPAPSSCRQGGLSDLTKVIKSPRAESEVESQSQDFNNSCESALGSFKNYVNVIYFF